MTAETVMLDEKELRRLEAGATAAPWCADSFATPEDSITRLAVDDGTGYGLRLAEFDWDPEHAEERDAPPLLEAEFNVRLSAALRNNIIPLLDRLSTLEAEKKAAVEALRPFAALFGEPVATPQASDWRRAFETYTTLTESTNVPEASHDH